MDYNEENDYNEEDEWDEMEDKSTLELILYQKISRQKEVLIEGLTRGLAMFMLSDYENCDKKCKETVIKAFKKQSLDTITEDFELFQRIVAHYTQASESFFNKRTRKVKSDEAFYIEMAMYYWSNSNFPIKIIPEYIEDHMKSHLQDKLYDQEKERVIRKPFSKLILEMPDFPSAFYHDITYLTGLLCFKLEQEFYKVFDTIKGVPITEESLEVTV